MILAYGNVQLNKNSFFIYNKFYERARLTQHNTQLMTYENMVYPDQLWMLEESTRHRGYYYIKNVLHQGYRLAKYGWGSTQVTVYNGYYYDDQLWRFQREGDYYRIYNKQYPTAKLTKYGKYNTLVSTYTGPNYDDQLWKLVPRFSASASEKIIWSINNW